MKGSTTRLFERGSRLPRTGLMKRPRRRALPAALPPARRWIKASCCGLQPLTAHETAAYPGLTLPCSKDPAAAGRQAQLECSSGGAVYSKRANASPVGATATMPVGSLGTRHNDSATFAMLAVSTRVLVGRAGRQASRAPGGGILQVRCHARRPTSARRRMCRGKYVRAGMCKGVKARALPTLQVGAATAARDGGYSMRMGAKLKIQLQKAQQALGTLAA